MTAIEHYELARVLGVDHGEAVVVARSFCPSGHGSGPHGSVCPCDDCTLIAVKAIDAVGRLRGTP